MYARKLILMAVAFMLFTSLAMSQDGQPTAEEMRKWTEYATPSKGHAYLEKMVGTWTADGTMWPAPGAPGMKNSGEAEMHMLLGGRYLLMTFNGSYMGMPFTGHNLMGYDNHFKRIESIWFDNMGTGFMHSMGTVDEKLTESRETFETPDIMTGKMIKSRSVTTFINADQFKMDMYWQKEGEAEFKTMEMIYTRKK